MLKTRVITSLILAPLVVLAILYLPPIVVGLIFAGVVLIGAWEWAGLLHASTAAERRLRTYFPMLVGAVMATVAVYTVPSTVLIGGVAFWVVATLWLAFPDFARASTVFNVRLKMAVGLFVLVPAWIAFVSLDARFPHGPWYALYAIAIAWVADVGAYFAGRRFGTTKLAPRISPGKTRAGAYGALIMVAIYAALGGWAFGFAGSGLAAFVGISLVTALASIVGDLFESLFKRHAGIKDSSQLIPGHGGLLDRIDSLTAALPVFAFGMSLL